MLASIDMQENPLVDFPLFIEWLRTEKATDLTCFIQYGEQKIKKERPLWNS